MTGSIPVRVWIRGRPAVVEALWYAAKCLFFAAAGHFQSRFKCALLRLFGAHVGRGVIIKPRVNISFPWKLTVGDRLRIGEEVFILNSGTGNHWQSLLRLPARVSLHGAIVLRVPEMSFPEASDHLGRRGVGGGASLCGPGGDRWL